MKRKNYFHFLAGRLIVGLIVASLIFMASYKYLESTYDNAVQYNGFAGLSERYENMVKAYNEGKANEALLKIIGAFYDADYVRFAKVNDDGKFETFYETDYNSVMAEERMSHWYCFTTDEDLLAKGSLTYLSSESDSEWTIEYKKCDEIGKIDNTPIVYLNNSEILNTMSDAYSYLNTLYLNVSELAELMSYKTTCIKTYYVDGDTLHIGKVDEVNSFGGKAAFGRSWDFTDHSKESLYQSFEEPLSGTLDYFGRTIRPVEFFEKYNDIFTADNMDDLPLEEYLDENTTMDDLKPSFREELRHDGLFTIGALKVVDINGQRYMIEYIITSLPFAEFFKPVLILIAIVLFVIAAAVACLLAIRPYVQYKKAYENNIFKNNLIDSLAHNMKTPLQILGGYAENLKDVKSEEEKDRYADQILEKTSDMNHDIEYILKSAEKSDRRFVKGSVRTCIEEVAAKTGVDVDIKGDANILMDKEYFKTALVCLIDNAGKYKTEGSPVEANVSSKEITIRNKTDMDKFTPGFGLAVAGRIIEQHKLKLKTELKDGVFEAKISKA